MNDGCDGFMVLKLSGTLFLGGLLDLGGARGLYLFVELLSIRRDAQCRINDEVYGSCG